MVDYKAVNKQRIYNSIIKTVYITRDIRFDEGYAYNSQLNEYNKKVGEFWSLKDDEQLAFQEKKLKDIILRQKKKQQMAQLQKKI